MKPGASCRILQKTWEDLEKWGKTVKMLKHLCFFLQWVLHTAYKYDVHIMYMFLTIFYTERTRVNDASLVQSLKVVKASLRQRVNITLMMQEMQPNPWKVNYRRKKA